MGTKSNPGKFDCYFKAGDDEPLFVLRAKDPLAANIVRRWADSYQLRKEIDNSKGHGPEELTEIQRERLNEALAVADAMDEWRLNVPTAH